MACDCRKKKSGSTSSSKEKQPGDKMVPGCKAIKSNELDHTQFLYSSVDGKNDGYKDT